MLPTNFLPVPPSGLDPPELELDPLELDPAPASFEPELEPLDVEAPLEPEPEPELAPELDPELEPLELEPEPLDAEVPLEPEPDAPELDAGLPLEPDPPDVDPLLEPEPVLPPSSGKPGLSDGEPHAVREAMAADSKYGGHACTESPFAHCFFTGVFSSGIRQALERSGLPLSMGRAVSELPSSGPAIDRIPHCL
jgi:hypothetical protein